MTNQPGCEETALLISKYVDGEATPEEREAVERHIAGCNTCACKLTEFMEVAAIFSEADHRPAEYHLHAGLFAHIERLKDEERRREIAAAAHAHTPPQEHGSRPPARAPYPWQNPRPQESLPVRDERGRGRAQSPRKGWVPAAGSLSARVWRVASPFALAGLAVVALLAMTLAAPQAPNGVAPQRVPDDAAGFVPPPGVPTIAPTSVSEILAEEQQSGLPAPVATGNPVPISSVSATVHATYAALGDDQMLKLEHPTAVLEVSDPQKELSLASWHVMRDPAFGYSIGYPPNWWTQTQGTTRMFYPWGPGGTGYAPYWIEMRVDANPQGLTADTANQLLFNGTCSVVPGAKDTRCLRHTTSDRSNVYDELYAFDPAHIYILRAAVPRQSTLGGFDERWQDAQAVFSRMSGSISMASETTAASSGSGYAPVLFLNHTDLWSVDLSGGGARAITQGYGVRAFAVSPALRQVAFIAANDSADALLPARYLYLASLDGPDSAGRVSGEQPALLWSGAKISDLAWYSDRELLVIAEDTEGGLGVYEVSLTSGKVTTTSAQAPATTRLLLKLGDDMKGARGLSVSPDRQIITFLAPLGENKGTDIYAFRPDGTDLRPIVTHSDLVAPFSGEQQALAAGQQAIKSYVWTSGKLEFGGYNFNMLLTCGNAESPTLYRGGFLYAAPSGIRAPLVDASDLGLADPSGLQVVHVAYSPLGKVAFTGFYVLRNYRAEELAGLWTADLAGLSLQHLTSQPVPESPHGIADLQWSPDGKSLIYRETIPQDEASMVSRYDGASSFLLVKLDPNTGQRQVLFDGGR